MIIIEMENGEEVRISDDCLIGAKISLDGESWNSVEEVKRKLMFADRNKWILGASND